jgi:hypothetical protein
MRDILEETDLIRLVDGVRWTCSSTAKMKMTRKTVKERWMIEINTSERHFKKRDRERIRTSQQAKDENDCQSTGNFQKIDLLFWNLEVT